MASPTSSGRYVFFQSLHEGDWLYPAKEDAIKRISMLGNIIGINEAYNQETQQFNERIEKYLTFIASMRDNLKSNELAFLQQQKTVLEQDNKEENAELIKSLDSLSTNTTNYLDIINNFNKLLQDQDRYAATVESEINRMNMVKNTYNDLNGQSWLAELFETKYKKYAGILASNVRKKNTKIIDDKKIDAYGKSVSELLSEKANTILKGLADDPEFLTTFTETLQSQGIDMSDGEFKNIIINIVADRVLNEPLGVNAKDLLQNIITDAKQNTLSLFNSVKDDEFFRIMYGDFKELEQLALTTKESLGKHIETLDNRSIKEIIKNYPVMKPLIQELQRAQRKHQDLSSIESKITKELRKAIRQRAENEFHIIVGQEPMDLSEFQARFNNVSSFITKTQVQKTLQSALRGVKFNHDAIGEMLASNDVKQRVVNTIVNNLPGVSISFKADIRFSTGYVGNNDIPIDDNNFNQIKDAIDTTIKDNYANFLLKYKEASHGQTDVASAMQVYKNWLNEMKTQFDAIIENDKELQQRFSDHKELYKEFYNTFSNSISVKDYTLYNNELGFHGGSLGSKTSPLKVIDNITTMYELGGISKADKEELLFAVINCGEALVGANIKPSLEEYLLGGAALIMFDDSFAASDAFLNQLIDGFKGQKIVNLYRINSKFIPASFVLAEIYTNLVDVYTQIQSNIDISTQHNRVTITNPINEGSLSEISGNTPEEQAKALSALALSSVSIQFSFMGGLLDILEGKLPKITQIK